jgi:hypothetical protein
MSETVTLEIPNHLARGARALASATHRRFEYAVVDWLRRIVEEPAVEAIGDGELLALCDATFDEADQHELSELLDGNREGSLMTVQRTRLEELMDLYRRGLVTKARAWKEAVVRGLRAPLSDDAA